LFNGRLSAEWANLQDNHLHANKLARKTQSGTLWTANIITAIWALFEVIWKLRNEVIYDHTPTAAVLYYAVKQPNSNSNRYTTAERSTCRGIAKCYSSRSTSIYNSLRTTAILNWWVIIHQPMLSDNSIIQSQKNSTTGVREITHYFPLSEEATTVS
jgi:hypothetical protein